MKHIIPILLALGMSAGGNKRIPDADCEHCKMNWYCSSKKKKQMEGNHCDLFSYNGNPEDIKDDKRN